MKLKKKCRSKLNFHWFCQQSKLILDLLVVPKVSHLSLFGVRLGLDLDLDLINGDHNTVLACLSSLDCASQGLETHAVTHLQRQPLIGHELETGHIERDREIEKERERETERQRDRDRERERQRQGERE